MPATAKIAKGYRARLGLIAFALIAFAGWGAYDGFIHYPKLIERNNAYQRIVEQHPQDFQQQWKQYAAEQGWPTEKPKDKEDSDLWFQYGIMIVALPIGLYFLLAFVRSRKRWIESTPESLRTHDGREARWDQIKNIDKSRWKSKGIAVVEYESDGQTKRITLDDWKFEREPTAAILAEVETHTGMGGESSADSAGESEAVHEQGEGETAADEPDAAADESADTERR
jgi:hypothetical protein